ncbi:hypothetical protein B0H14DRAFT_95456 [Mycena olivaceomarginata]|nr:hypothetical protein B0H14DRAFT_95456 [Mycena olivaceomarginata]
MHGAHGVMSFLGGGTRRRWSSISTSRRRTRGACGNLLPHSYARLWRRRDWPHRPRRLPIGVSTSTLPIATSSSAQHLSIFASTTTNPSPAIASTPTMQPSRLAGPGLPRRVPRRRSPTRAGARLLALVRGVRAVERVRGSGGGGVVLDRGELDSPLYVAQGYAGHIKKAAEGCMGDGYSSAGYSSTSTDAYAGTGGDAYAAGASGSRTPLSSALEDGSYTRARRTVREDHARRACVWKDAMARPGSGSATAGGSGYRGRSARRHTSDMQFIAYDSPLHVPVVGTGVGEK